MKQDLLNEALGSWKSRERKSGLSLDSGRRAALKQAVWAEAKPDASSWGVAWSSPLRWAAALGIPSVALAMILGLGWLNSTETTEELANAQNAGGGVTPPALSQPLIPADLLSEPGSPQIEVSKENGEVVFRVAGLASDSRGSHRVMKSDLPNRFRPESGEVIVEGAYSDSLDSGGTLTFYRID